MAACAQAHGERPIVIQHYARVVLHIEGRAGNGYIEDAKLQVHKAHQRGPNSIGEPPLVGRVMGHLGQTGKGHEGQRQN